MDTGKQINDYKFYKGYEGENDVVLSLEDTSYHFWDGFLKTYLEILK